MLLLTDEMTSRACADRLNDVTYLCWPMKRRYVFVLTDETTSRACRVSTERIAVEELYPATIDANGSVAYLTPMTLKTDCDLHLRYTDRQALCCLLLSNYMYRCMQPKWNGNLNIMVPCALFAFPNIFVCARDLCVGRLTLLLTFEKAAVARRHIW